MSQPTARQKTLAIKAMAACGGVRSVVGTVISPSALDSMDDAMDVDEEVVPIPDFGLSHAAVSVMLFFFYQRSVTHCDTDPMVRLVRRLWWSLDSHL